MPSDSVQRTERGRGGRGGRGGERAGQRRGIISFSHAFIWSAQRPWQHHAVYISLSLLKPTLTKS